MTPYQLGKKAFLNDINFIAHDKEMRTWLKENTTGEVGSSKEHMVEWYNGFSYEASKELV